jgi:hypothetical protein
MQNTKPVEGGWQGAELEAERANHRQPGGTQTGFVQAQRFQRPPQNGPDDIVVPKEEITASMCFLTLVMPGFDCLAPRKTS